MGLHALAARQRGLHPPAAAAAAAAATAAADGTAVPPPPALPTDYRRGSPITFRYVKRGYHVLCSHGLKMVLMPLAAMGLVSQADRLLSRRYCRQRQLAGQRLRQRLTARHVVEACRRRAGCCIRGARLCHPPLPAAAATARVPPPRARLASRLPPPAGACRAPTPAARPCCRPAQLELANMWKNGEIQDMWGMARQTHLTFNMVGSCRAPSLSFLFLLLLEAPVPCLGTWVLRLLAAGLHCGRLACCACLAAPAASTAVASTAAAAARALAQPRRPSSAPTVATPALLARAMQVTFGLTCALLVFVAATYIFTRTRPVYLLNFHCFKPPAK